MYENREKGPNHYNLLGVPRGCPTTVLKKAYRNLSLELHPDKNKSPEVGCIPIDIFNIIGSSFDIVSIGCINSGISLVAYEYST